MTVSNCPICADGSPELSSSLELISEDPVEIVQDPVTEPAPNTASVEEPAAPTIDEPVEDQPDIEDQYAEVGKGSDEGANAARRKTWQRVAIAAAAVVVATIAIILVSLNEIEVEILKTQAICVLSLAVHGQPVRACENDPSHTLVNVRIGEKTFRELATLHAGGQRIKLSAPLQEAMLAQFRTGGAVEIELPGYKKKIAAGNFPDLASQLDEPPLFENPIQLPF